jgi:anthranilate phosphoribosyltransferase
MIQASLTLVEAGGDLSMDQMAAVVGFIMEGKCTDDEIARLLVALHTRGETVAEVAGAAAALRKHMTPIRTRHEDVVDVVGTGGDRSGTFNISTAAALVTAAAGVPVAKHGNRRVTSPSGAADVLAELGVHVEADVPIVEACLDELGICFCFAPLLHKAMKHVAPVRQKLGIPTIFNILGPLANPAQASFQLLGVGRPELRPLLAEALSMLGARRVLVVHGSDGLDEVTLGGTTYVTEASAAAFSRFEWEPSDFGLPPCSRDSLLVKGPKESAAVIRDILYDRPGPPRDVVVANAAAALWTVGKDDSLVACARLADEAIQSGKARELLARLAERTHADDGVTG